MNERWTYWTDGVAQEVKRRVEKSKVLQKVVREKGYIVNDAKTPSGKIHVGSARGWIIHDMITKSMKDQGMKVKFILGNDDMDPFDNIPPNLDREKFKEFLGMPLVNVPSPVAGYDNYADYYFNQCVEKFEDFDIEAEIYKTSKLYFDGKFNEAIRIVLDNVEKIQKIYKNIYGKSIGVERLPFTPICEKCGKIGTTIATQWDKTRGLVKYKCKPDLVKWAIGCGHENEVSPYDGNGKMVYKVEWPMKWFVLGVVCESAGKDHFTKGGSRDVSVAISCKVFKFPPPWPSTCKEIGQGYEFFLVGGKKMSTSKGLGVSFVEVADTAPPELLRFLMVKTRPESAIEFNPEGNTIPFLFREFNEIEKIYFGLKKVEEKDRNNARRVYELTVKEIPKQKPYRIPFDFAAMLVQTLPRENRFERIVNILKRIGHIKELTESERNILEQTINYAEIWTQRFAPAGMRIKILESVPEKILKKLSQQQRLALNKLGEFLEETRTDREIWDEIKKYAKSLSVKPEKIFEAAYLILLGRNYGPRLIPFIQSLDREFVMERFKSVR